VRSSYQLDSHMGNTPFRVDERRVAAVAAERRRAQSFSGRIKPRYAG
jgi:hypothetical protein